MEAGNANWSQTQVLVNCNLADAHSQVYSDCPGCGLTGKASANRGRNTTELES